MTAVSDSLIYGRIFSTPESAAIWSDITRTQYYLKWEAALATAQARLGIIPMKAAKHIRENAVIDIIDWDDLRQKTETIGYPILPVVQQLVRKVNHFEAGLGEWAHWGATTQDVTDTTTILQLRDTLDLIAKQLESVLGSLRKLAEEHKATPMAARSNLQQAVPISYGFKMARLLATFQRHRERLNELRPRLLVVEFGGAAGTLATISDNLGLKCQAELARELGLGIPEIAWHTERDRIAEVGAWFAMVTGTCSKFALDLKLMMQTEVGEASEPYMPHRGSSSTMPQKRNPIGTAYITAMASTVRQMSASLFDCMVQDHERSTGPWEIEWIVLPQICTLTHATMKHTAELLAGLEVHENIMKRNLDISKGAIVSEAVMMGLGRSMGRQYAHDVVYDLCRTASKQDRSLVELLAAHEEVSKHLSIAELEKLCDPKNYMGMSIEMVDRLLTEDKTP
ncbi:MAG: hypothetical protein Q9227_005879 [Pyrenula ochraceoflavens]